MKFLCQFLQKLQPEQTQTYRQTHTHTHTQQQQKHYLYRILGGKKIVCQNERIGGTLLDPAMQSFVMNPFNSYCGCLSCNHIHTCYYVIKSLDKVL